MTTFPGSRVRRILMARSCLAGHMRQFGELDFNK